MKTLSTKYQKGLCAVIVILFCFIVYRTYVISRLCYPSFLEALTINEIQKRNKDAVKKAKKKGSSGGGSKQPGRGGSGNMIAKTGQKIKIIQMAIIKKFRIKSFKNLNPIVEFKDISLSYGNRLILDNISFKVNQGQISQLLLGHNDYSSQTFIQD